MMPGKPRRLTDDQLERAQRLVDDGYSPKGVAERFGMTTSQLNHYGVKRRHPAPAREEKPNTPERAHGN